MTAVSLNAIVSGTQHRQPLIILHGLFGAASNWRGLSKQFAAHFQVHVLDLRNHGDSPHTPEHDYSAMAADLLAYIETKQLKNVYMLGHSMGGKAAMALCLQHSDHVAKLVVADMAPKQYPASAEHQQVINALSAIPLADLQSRNDADAVLADHGIILPIRQFLLTNLVKEPEGFRWKINLPVLAKNYPNINQAVSGSAFNKPSLFIRGGNSDYVTDGDWPLIESLFPQAQLENLAGAGHWLHAEQPAQFMSKVLMFLGDE